MCADKANINNAIGILDDYHKPIAITLYAENNAIISEKTGLPLIFLDIRWRFPVKLLNSSEPCPQGLFNLRMFFPKLSQGAAGYDSHVPILHCYHSGIKLAGGVWLAR